MELYKLLEDLKTAVKHYDSRLEDWEDGERYGWNYDFERDNSKMFLDQARDDVLGITFKIEQNLLEEAKK